MTNDPTFAEFIRRIRAGDEDAAAELVRRYETVIRTEVRLRLTDPGLFRLFDSMDICQSVLASFFIRAVAGQYDLDQPQQLRQLLLRMARNKLAFQVRRAHFSRRDCRRTVAVSEAREVASRGPSPAELAAGRELLDKFRERLTEEERQLADLRAQGHDWAEIASRLGGTPQARRKQLARAAERVASQLGFDPATVG